jgi:NADH:ubiquinone oxidoreductase subunit 2 (subunit N)
VLVIIGIIMSVISTGYYIRIIQIMYFERKEDIIGEIEIKKENKVIIGISVGIIMGILIKPRWILEIGHEVAMNII